MSTKLFIINNEWNSQPWFSTGGTRAKKYLQSPDGVFYYFKRSQYKPATETKAGKDYKYEFWSEIIAFELGTMLGFNVLRYDLAIDGDIMGCICETMIDSEKEELVEGVKYLQASNPKYDPSNKQQHSLYTFQFIEIALREAGLDNEIENILELIIFDCLIGNGDRHQENWAIITTQNLTKEIVGLHKQLYTIDKIFAPIYDNGSSLGRELLEERVDQYVKSDEVLLQYILNGKSEIHWENKKLNHFDLIQNLLSTSYCDKILLIIKRVLERFNPHKLEDLINSIDQSVPELYSKYKIPDNRKLLIIKMINLRFKKLKEFVND